jgi:hypothetical protein
MSKRYYTDARLSSEQKFVSVRDRAFPNDKTKDINPTTPGVLWWRDVDSEEALESACQYARDLAGRLNGDETAINEFKKKEMK